LRQFTGTAAPLAVVLITDPEQPGPAKLDLLVQLYGLTPKEAEIAVNLSQGKTVEQTAEQLGMTYQTARTHLRRLFIKTGTSRQTELLLLLARLPGSATSSS
jgi:DNA-binding CsgD family transcriptional regulator